MTEKKPSSFLALVFLALCVVICETFVLCHKRTTCHNVNNFGLLRSYFYYYNINNSKNKATLIDRRVFGWASERIKTSISAFTKIAINKLPCIGKSPTVALVFDFVFALYR